jgi:Leucine-rich repeat (LRR) protein
MNETLWAYCSECGNISYMNCNACKMYICCLDCMNKHLPQKCSSIEYCEMDRELEKELEKDKNCIYSSSNRIIQGCAHNLYAIKINMLKIFPMNVLKMVHIQRLEFTNGELIEIPEEICRLPFLQGLVVNDNLLVSLPQSLITMNKLSYINFANNLIRTFPLFLPRRPITLNCNGNPLQTTHKPSAGWGNGGYEWIFSRGWRDMIWKIWYYSCVLELISPIIDTFYVLLQETHKKELSLKSYVRTN